MTGIKVPWTGWCHKNCTCWYKSMCVYYCNLISVSVCASVVDRRLKSNDCLCLSVLLCHAHYFKDSYQFQRCVVDRPSWWCLKQLYVETSVLRSFRLALLSKRLRADISVNSALPLPPPFPPPSSTISVLIKTFL